MGGPHDEPTRPNRLGPADGGGGGRSAEHVPAVHPPLIAERRIEFVKVGRHVRISESVLTDFIDAGRVKPLTAASTQRKRQELRNGKPRWTPTFRQRPQT